MPSPRAAITAALALLTSNVVASPAAAKTTRSACQAPVVSALKKYPSSASFCTSFDQITTETTYTNVPAPNTVTLDANCTAITTSSTAPVSSLAITPATTNTVLSSSAITPATTNTILSKRAASKTDIPKPLRRYASASLSSACDCLSFATPTVTVTDTFTNTVGPAYCTGGFQAIGPEEVTVDISIDDNYLGGSTVCWGCYSPDEYVLTGYPDHAFQLNNDGTYAYVADPINGGVLNFTTDGSGAGYKLHCDLESTEHVVCYNANATPFLYYVLNNDNTTMRLGLTVPADGTKHQLYWGY